MLTVSTSDWTPWKRPIQFESYLGAKPEGHADAEADVPLRPEVHGEKETRHELRFAGIAAAAVQCRIAERCRHASLVLELGAGCDVGAAKRKVFAGREARHAGGVPPHGGRVFRDSGRAGIGVSEAADPLLVKREARGARLERAEHEAGGRNRQGRDVSLHGFLPSIGNADVIG